MRNKISNINQPLLFALLYCIFILYGCFCIANGEMKNYDRWAWEIFIHKLTIHNLKDIAVNVVFYIPLGLLIALARVHSQKKNRFTIWILFGAIFSSIIELLQPFFGRYSDPADIISNTIGYIYGYLMIMYIVDKLRHNAI